MPLALSDDQLQTLMTLAAEAKTLTDMHLIAVMIGVIVVGPIIMWALVQIANNRWNVAMLVLRGRFDDADVAEAAKRALIGLAHRPAA